MENRKLQDWIQEIAVPTETVTEIKDGKKREVERKIFPGYVLVKMVMTDDSWYVVRNTRGCTGLRRPQWEADSSDGGRGRRPGGRKSARSRSITTWATWSGSSMDRWRISPAMWMRSTGRRIRCGSPFPCSGGKRRRAQAGSGRAARLSRLGWLNAAAYVIVRRF